MREDLSVLLRTAVAVAEHGSPAHCVQKTQISSATVYRHIDELERVAGCRLFARKRGQWRVLPEAERVLASARQLERCAGQAQLELSLVAGKALGSLTIALSEDFAAYYVVRHLRAFRETGFGEALHLKISNRFADLENSEADIAIRPHHSPGEALVGRRVGQLHHAFYAATDYVRRHGKPTSIEMLAGHVICGFGSALADFDAARWMKRNVAADRHGVYFDSTMALAHAVQDGVGIGLLPCYVGDQLDEVEHVLTPKGGLPVTIWIVTAKAKRARPGIKSFMTYFAEAIRRDRRLFSGAGD